MSAIDRRLEAYGLSGLRDPLVTYVCGRCHSVVGELRPANDKEQALLIAVGDTRAGQIPHLFIASIILSKPAAERQPLWCPTHGFGLRSFKEMTSDWNTARRSKPQRVRLSMKHVHTFLESEMQPGGPTVR